jgi:hypothetical protein
VRLGVYLFFIFVVKTSTFFPINSRGFFLFDMVRSGQDQESNTAEALGKRAKKYAEFCKFVIKPLLA